MANSADVTAHVDTATATQYNNLRADVLHTSSGHLHDGSNGRQHTSVPTNNVLFPATQSASSDANALDDYEEGSYTVGLTFGGSATGISYSDQTGRYVKIGRQVFFNARITLTSKGSSTGGAVLTGNPFTCAYAAAASVKFNNLSYDGQVTPQVNPSATTIRLMEVNQTTGSDTDIDDTNFAYNTTIIVTGHYEV